MSVCIIGLDIAQATTGMARVYCTGLKTSPLSVQWGHVTSAKGKGFYDDQSRADNTLEAIKRWIGAEVLNPDVLVVAEDFAFGIQMAGTRSVAMMTGIIRYWLWKKRIPFVLVSPAGLKKFVVGRASKKGDKIGKEIVNRELYARFGHAVDQNDAADAVGLAYVGAAIKGIWTPQNDAQREVLVKLKVQPFNG